jgi:hypothetical protein
MNSAAALLIRPHVFVSFVKAVASSRSVIKEPFSAKHVELRNIERYIAYFFILISHRVERGRYQIKILTSM